MISLSSAPRAGCNDWLMRKSGATQKEKECWLLELLPWCQITLAATCLISEGLIIVAF